MATYSRNIPYIHAILVEGIGPTDSSYIDTSSGSPVHSTPGGFLYVPDSEHVSKLGSSVQFNPSDLSTNDVFEFDTNLLEDSIRPVSTSSPISTVPTRWGAFDLQMRAKDHIAELFLHRENKPVAELGADITDSTTLIGFSNTNIPENSIVYIGSETVLVGSKNAGKYQDCDRGMFSSTARSWPEGTNVYLKPPNWSRRQIRLYTFQPYQAEPVELKRKLLGIIDGSCTQSQGRVQIPVTELLSTYQDRLINKNPTQFFDHTLSWDYKERKRSIPNGNIFFNTSIEKSSVHTATGAKRGYVQLDEIIWPYEGTSVVSDATPPLGCRLKVPKVDQETGTQKVDTVHEVYVVDRIKDKDASFYEDMYSSTRKLRDVTYNHADKYPFHPVAIAGAHMLSTSSTSAVPDNFDVFQLNYSLDLYWLLGDDFITELHNVIQQTPYIQIDQAVIGFDGENLKLIEFIEKVLFEPYGFKWGVKNDGSLTVQHTSLIDVDKLVSANTNLLEVLDEGVLDINNGEDRVLEVIEGRIGGLPWQEGRISQIQLRDEPEFVDAITDDPDQSVDFSTIGVQNVEKAELYLEEMGIIQSYNMQRLRARIPDHIYDNLDYSLGAECHLQDLPLDKGILLDRGGNRVKVLNPTIEFTGVITDRRYLPQSRTYEVEITFIGDRLVRHRAPSGIITGVTSSKNQIELTDTFPFEAKEFNVGDEIQIYNQTGTLHESTVATVDVVDTVAGNLILTSWPYTTDPSADQIVRLADWGNYSNTSAAQDPVDRKYVYGGDLSEPATLGSSDDDSDIFG